MSIDAAADGDLEALHLKVARAVDFRTDKRASLGRRMAAVGAADYHAYVEHLRSDPDEERCFDRSEAGGVLRPELRRAVIFDRHDPLQDLPISRINLLIGRDTLMYFTAEAQTRVLRQFALALRETTHADEPGDAL